LSLEVSRDVLENVRHLEPDVIVLDTWLHHADEGVSLIKAFSRDPALARVPVLVGTSDPGAFEQQTESLSLSQRIAVLNRPFSIEDLLKYVRELLEGSS
jgi:CheY-like chemotaxis protein